MLQLQNVILEMIAKGEALKPTTDRLCLEIEKGSPDLVCSILSVDQQGFLHPLSGPSLPEEYSASIEGVAIGPTVGSCGSAAYSRSPVAVTDIETDHAGMDSESFRSLLVSRHAGLVGSAIAADARSAHLPSIIVKRGGRPKPNRPSSTSACICAPLRLNGTSVFLSANAEPTLTL